jgi:hypothetical protein
VRGGRGRWPPAAKAFGRGQEGTRRWCDAAGGSGRWSPPCSRWPRAAAMAARGTVRAPTRRRPTVGSFSADRARLDGRPGTERGGRHALSSGHRGTGPALCLHARRCGNGHGGKPFPGAAHGPVGPQPVRRLRHLWAGGDQLPRQRGGALGRCEPNGSGQRDRRVAAGPLVERRRPGPGHRRHPRRWAHVGHDLRPLQHLLGWDHSQRWELRAGVRPVGELRPEWRRLPDRPVGQSLQRPGHGDPGQQVQRRWGHLERARHRGPRPDRRCTVPVP